MDDNRFNKIMEDYVSSTSNEMDIDLKKLPERPKKNKNLFYKIVLSSSVAVVALLLIILPIYFLNTEQEQPIDETRYYDSNSVDLQAVEDIAQLGDFGIKEYIESQISVQPSVYVYTLTEEQSKVLGAHFRYNVFDYDFERITIDVIQKQNKLQEFALYENFTDTEKWNGIKAKFRVKYDDMKEIYNTQIYFSDNKYDYFIEAEHYDQLEPSIILDYIY